VVEMCAGTLVAAMSGRVCGISGLLTVSRSNGFNPAT
jgi:hypothetical protein